MRRWVIGFGVLNVVLFLALLVVLLQRGPGRSDADAEASDSSTPTATESADAGSDGGSEPDQSEDAEPTATDSDGEVVYQFPAGTLELTDFTLPSGNITCALEASQVTCWIASKSYPAPEGMTCEWAGQVFVLSEAGVDLPCPASAPATGSDVPVLEYGQGTAIGPWYCLSSTSGVSCSSYAPVTGDSRGFTIARADYTLIPAG